MAQSVSELSVKPAKAVTSWLTDQIAPAYWKPNSLILVSDTHTAPPSATSTSQVNTFVSRGMFTVWRCAAVTQSYMCPGHEIKTWFDSDCVLSPSGSGSITTSAVIVFFSFRYKVCHKCHTVFQDNDTKHHCRACGEGFCDGCSTKAAPVPERGWGLAPVRVCDICFEQRASYAGTRTPSDVKCSFVCYAAI